MSGAGAVAVSSSDRFRQVAFEYFQSLAVSGSPTWRRAGWSGPDTQRRRWQVFLDALPLGGSSVIDVGAGAGGFRSFLHEMGAGTSRYIGVDLVPANCGILSAEHGVDAVVCGTIDSTVRKPWADYVTASGVFNFDEDGWVDYFVVEAVEYLHRARHAVVLNALVPRTKWCAAMRRLESRNVRINEVESGDARERTCVLSHFSSTGSIQRIGTS
jgi:hypothetical protein